MSALAPWMSQGAENRPLGGRPSGDHDAQEARNLSATPTVANKAVKESAVVEAIAEAQAR